MNRVLFASCVLLSLLTGCSPEMVDQPMDANRILAMAGEEAGQISSAKERLTRQLNIANQQNENARYIDARATLVEARKTLEAAVATPPTTAPAESALSDQERLAGWVSISELSRAAGDPAAANDACDRAVKDLSNLSPVASRADYVMSLAAEVLVLHGKPAAAKLLVQGGDWASQIKDEKTRRQAYLAIAEDLFRCDDYEAGRTVLRHDTDAAWRSDSLTTIADDVRTSNSNSGGTLPNPKATMADYSSSKSEQSPQQSGFGKSVNFQNNYYKPNK